VTEPEGARPRKATAPGRWVLGGIVVVLVAVAVFVVVRRDRSRPEPEAGRTSAAPASSAPAQLCTPTVSESGFSAVRKVVRFGLIVTSSCTQAAVNTVITVDALDAKGAKLPVSDGPDPSVDLPVLLPGQRLGLGGQLFLIGDASRARKLAISVSRTQNIPATEFASWPRSVTVTGLHHSDPGADGYTEVTGTVTTYPPGITLCNPAFYLVLRAAKNTIVYGQHATQQQPSFSGDMPADVDWSSAQISVVQGVPTLGNASGATLSCRTS
jgi:hypothetical protein